MIMPRRDIWGIASRNFVFFRNQGVKELTVVKACPAYHSLSSTPQVECVSR